MTCIALHNTELTADFVVGFNAAHASIFPDLIHADPEQPGIWFLNVDPVLSATQSTYALYHTGMLLLNVIQLPPYPFKVVESLQPDALLVVEDMAIANAESIYATVHSFRDVQINALAVEGWIHRVQVSASAGLVRALQAFLCLAMSEHCATLEKTEKQEMDSVVFNRHAHLLNQANVPYLLRYMSARDILATWGDRRKSLLEMPGVSLTGTNSHEARYKAISLALGRGEHLVDIGCGKAYLLTRLAERYKQIVGYEANWETLEYARFRVHQSHLKKIQLRQSFTEDLVSEIPEDSHVLMTEVLEHMPIERARSLLIALSACTAEKMIFTVPNRLFNKHYGLAPGAFRHWDHHWEPDAFELHELMQGALSERWYLSYVQVGDVVQGQPSTLMAVATRKDFVGHFFRDDYFGRGIPDLSDEFIKAFNADVAKKRAIERVKAYDRARSKAKTEARRALRLKEKAAAERMAAKALAKEAAKAERKAAAKALRAAVKRQAEALAHQVETAAVVATPVEAVQESLGLVPVTLEPKSKAPRKSPSKPKAPKAEPPQG